jgi:hypothetical protein
VYSHFDDIVLWQKLPCRIPRDLPSNVAELPRPVSRSAAQLHAATDANECHAAPLSLAKVSDPLRFGDAPASAMLISLDQER